VRVVISNGIDKDMCRWRELKVVTPSAKGSAIYVHLPAIDLYTP